MKKIVLLLSVMSFVLALGQAQKGPSTNQRLSISDWQQLRNELDVSMDHDGERLSSSVSFPLDYDSLDARAAGNQGGIQYQRFAWDVNENYTNTDNSKLDWCAQVYDSLYNYQTNTAYTRQNNTVQIDSMLVFFRHLNVTGNSDSIVFSILRNNTLGISGQAPNDELTGDVFWRSSIVASQSLSPQNFGGFVIDVDTVLPDQGESFTFRLQVYGDTANTFQVLAGSAFSCFDSCGARSSVIKQTSIASIETNSLYYLNLTQNGQNFSGINPISFQGPPVCPQSCTAYVIQNFAFIPFITLKGPANTEDRAAGMRSDFTVYPNPTNGRINIRHRINNQRPIQLSIFNLRGEKVYAETLSPGNGKSPRQLNIGNLTNGVYLLKLQTDDAIITDKITVTN